MKEKQNLIKTKVTSLIGKSKDRSGQKGKVDALKPDIVENPLRQMTLTNDLETDCKTESDIMLAALQNEDELAKKAAYKAADARIHEQSEITNDTEYFFCVMFETRQQKEAFIAGMGWALFGDKYMNGLHLARKQNIVIPEATLPPDRGNKRSMFREMVDPDMDNPDDDAS